MIKLHLLALSCSLLALAWCIMAREPLHAALAADLERLGHDVAAVAAGTWPTRKLTDRSLQFLRGRTLHAFLGPLKTHPSSLFLGDTEAKA